jgi:hypothetical protein
LSRRFVATNRLSSIQRRQVDRRPRRGGDGFGPSQRLLAGRLQARAKQRSPAGALRLIERGKLSAAKIAGEFVSTIEALRPYRRYGNSIARLAA